MQSLHGFELAYSNNYFNLAKICFEGIRNRGKIKPSPKRLKKVCHQIFAVWEVQTMWILQKNVLCAQRRMFTNVLNMGLPLGTWVKKINA